MAYSRVRYELVCTMVLLCMLIAAPNVDAAMSCGEVANMLLPCLNYIVKGGPLPVACCNGVRRLNSRAKATPDRQVACNCMRSGAARVPGLKMNLASTLPSRCGVNIPYKISPSTDCSRVR